jgi:hypothetical protein
VIHGLCLPFIHPPEFKPPSYRTHDAARRRA